MISGKRRKRQAIAIAAIFASSSLLQGCGKKHTGSVSSVNPAGEASEPIHLRATFDDVTAKSGIDSVYNNGEDVGIHSIVESLGGEEMPERIPVTQGWQEFTLYRAALNSGEVTVKIALTGIGEAMVDELTIRTINLPPLESRQARNEK